MAAPPVVPLVEVPNKDGDWCAAKISAWMVIKWPGLLGLNTNITLPDWVASILKLLFPPRLSEGVTIELIQASVDYGLNEIPSASVQVAVGRLADNVALCSAIHYLIKQLRMFVAASIYCQVESTASSGDADVWPTNPDGSPRPFRIFDGFITNSALRKTNQGVEFTCALTNWLSDLNFSSAFSRSSSAMNPGDISYDGAFPVLPNAGARIPGLFTHGTAMTQAVPFVNEATLMADLWGKTVELPTGLKPGSVAAVGVGGLKQWFTELCMQDRINWRQLQNASCDVPPPPTDIMSKNVEALAALMRIEPLSLGYIDGVPLKMDSTRAEIITIAKSIAAQIGMHASTLYNHTIWDKLVGQFLPDLQLALAPQVEKALVVPFAPGLRRSWVTIFANEYEYYENADLIIRPLRGVGLFINSPMASGGNMGLVNRPVINSTGAYYENPDRRNGLVIWRNAPYWLATAPLPYMYNPASGSISGATTLDTKKGAVPTVKPVKCRLEALKSLWCDYARGLYLQEILRGRTGRLSGKLRFDIAPGSIIRIEEPEEPFVLENLGTNRSYVYAQAIRVSCVINSEAAKAGTAIQFAFARDEQENLDPSYSASRHPLWANNWYGAPLVSEDVFYPGGRYPGVSPPESKALILPFTDACSGKSTLPVTVAKGTDPEPPLPIG